MKTTYPENLLIHQIYDLQGKLKYIKVSDFSTNDYKGYCFDINKNLIGTFKEESFYDLSGKELFHTIGLKFF